MDDLEKAQQASAVQVKEAKDALKDVVRMKEDAVNELLDTVSSLESAESNMKKELEETRQANREMGEKLKGLQLLLLLLLLFTLLLLAAS